MSARPGTCSVCTSPHRDEVQRRAAAGESLRKIAEGLGLGRGPVQRHIKNHVAELRVPVPAREVLLASEILTEAVEVAREILGAARREGKDERALRAIDRHIALATILLKKAGEIQSGTVVNLNFGADPEAVVRMVVAELTRRGYRVIPPEATVELAALPAAVGAEVDS